MFNRKELNDQGCPICGRNSENRCSLEFSERMGLPVMIGLSVCATCNFAYVTPRESSGYARYYASSWNDQSGSYVFSAMDIERYEAQVATMSHILAQRKSLRILDIGCGHAGLLRTMHRLYPHHHYHGSDPAVSQEGYDKNGIMFSAATPSEHASFDLIILSHVMEHILDLAGFSSLTPLLVPSGTLYVETPDSSRYHDCHRREYLYYIDRLHVNHFTTLSLSKLMRKWGLTVSQSGTRDFRYKDDLPYPVCYVLADFSSGDAPPPHCSEQLGDVLQRYFSLEGKRAMTWRQRLKPDEEIVVYGFGDNFFRSRMPDGPLHGYRIQAVTDIRWQELSQTSYAHKYRFLSMKSVIREYVELPFVVTISQGAGLVERSLRQAGVRRVFIL